MFADENRTISKWMIYIWFGLDGTGIQRSVRKNTCCFETC